MSDIVDEGLLDQRMAALETARAWSPRLTAKLESLIRGDEQALFRVNPYRFAANRNVTDNESIDLFLHATAQRIFTMDWVLICPGCSCSVESFRSLQAVHGEFHCGFCNADWQTTLDDFIAVSFTISPDIRDIAFHHPESLSPATFCFDYVMNAEGVISGTTQSFADVLRAATPAVAYLVPNEATRFEIEAKTGVLLKGWSVDSDARLGFKVEGEPNSSPQQVSIRYGDKGCEPDSGVVAPGRVVFTIENHAMPRNILGISLIPLEPERPPLAFTPFLSGKRLVTTQTFRDLFRSEVVGGSEGLGVRDVTLLFTDLKGSTALYDRIGDLNAFALVQGHFERLRVVTALHGGAVVKTIGDAVMATFAEPAAAVAASLAMRREIADFNSEQASRDLVLKIGLHRGAAIAVTLNDRLDYFGQTVNIAARVQGLAGSDEIFLSADVHGADGVAALLTPFTVEPRVARLRGVGQEMTVFRISPSA